MQKSDYQLPGHGAFTLQSQICGMLIDAILDGRLSAGDPVPSTRAMAIKLKVSRNTVTFAYQALVINGFLASKDRRGYFVAENMVREAAPQGQVSSQAPAAGSAAPDWNTKITPNQTRATIISRPIDWHSYPYPFVYGQLDPSLFPIEAWRDCVRQAMSRKWFNAWTDDLYFADDPLLVEQIRAKMLNPRGIFARPEEILVTLGSQNALYMLASLLIRPGTSVAVENPGYYAAREIFSRAGAKIQPVPVDSDGLDPGQLGGARLVFATPSHHFPTNATLSLERRYQLLKWAEQTDALIIEDDYEAESDFSGQATMPIKALDRNSRVIYVGSFSKSLMPGLRLGFAVADKRLIAEMRNLRGLMMRHPPSNNQRTVALFLAFGHHDASLSRLRRIYTQRWKVLSDALEWHFLGWKHQTKFGGSSFWLEGDKGFSATYLAKKALAEGVVIEPGKGLFYNTPDSDRFFRLGFSSISEDRIDTGIKHLRKAWERLAV